MQGRSSGWVRPASVQKIENGEMMYIGNDYTMEPERIGSSYLIPMPDGMEPADYVLMATRHVEKYSGRTFSMSGPLSYSVISALRAAGFIAAQTAHGKWFNVTDYSSMQIATYTETTYTQPAGRVSIPRATYNTYGGRHEPNYNFHPSSVLASRRYNISFEDVTDAPEYNTDYIA